MLILVKDVSLALEPDTSQFIYFFGTQKSDDS